MRALTLFVALAVLATPAAAAQKPTKPTNAELESAQKTLSYIVSALNSKEVPIDMKSGLFGCLYDNSLHKIAAARDEVLAKNKGKIDTSDATQQLVVIAEICGAPVPKPGDTKAGTKSHPTGR